MAECIQNCPLAARVDSLEGQVDEFQAQNSSSHKEIFGRLNALEKSEAVQGVHYKAILAKLDTLTLKVDQLEQKPGKRWEAVVVGFLGALAGAAATYLITGGLAG